MLYRRSTLTHPFVQTCCERSFSRFLRAERKILQHETNLSLLAPRFITVNQSPCFTGRAAVIALRKEAHAVTLSLRGSKIDCPKLVHCSWVARSRNLEMSAVPIIACWKGASRPKIMDDRESMMDYLPTRLSDWLVWLANFAVRMGGHVSAGEADHSGERADLATLAFDVALQHIVYPPLENATNLVYYSIERFWKRRLPTPPIV